MAPIDDPTDAFFREGLFRYAEARATVIAYEDAAARKVADVARREAPPLLSANARVQVEASGVVNGDDGGRVAYAHFAGTFGGEDVIWEIGIWWPLPSDSRDVLVYVECWKGPDHLVKEQWATAPTGDPNKWQVYKGGMNRELKPGDDIDAVFERLLAEVAKQSSASLKRTSGLPATVSKPRQ